MSSSSQASLAVIGAGSWGTALAILFAKNGLHTTIWGHLPEHMQALTRTRCNEEFLPGFNFPDNLHPCVELEQALENADDVLLVVPSHVFKSVLLQVKPLLPENKRIAWATKGLESGTAKLLHENALEVMGQGTSFAIISGPTFAKEVAAGLPTALTIASTDDRYAKQLAEKMQNSTFRAYTCNDIIGVELGGAIKNVLAIAAGIADGLGFGANTRAALITRGLTEIMRLGKKLGGETETFMGLAGMGDLVLTCTDNQSRNRRFGIALAKGMNPDEALASIGQVVEGIQTANEINRLALRHKIDMPITRQVYRVLYEQVDPKKAVQELFARELKPEFENKA
ncbi:MAG: NAD(P)H-dependent glycerol-3-phosphate dehydrogenase [Gammaproteobacteria bacterium]|nr:NAD(P)H-dependent glycerol-3-phosphate dehydrogenase [Gammaproteobacteria bacterium]